MRFMLDTNMCIYIIRKKPSQVLERFKNFQISEIGVSAITLSELEFGIAKSSQPEKNREALIEFLTPLEIVSFDERAARYYGELRALMEKKGKPIGAMDLLIACHAISLSVPLVTNDTRGFKGIPELQLENWV
jgi:tRNA(fMet)-specific endonuclease VapC